MAKSTRVDDDRSASSVRVLVVEHSEPFRRFIRSMLQKRPEFQVICEVSDGLEAVQKAGELQPDLIVLDLGLPTLDGIEAARRIRSSPRIQNTLRESRIFCGCGTRSSSHRGTWLRRQNTRRNRGDDATGFVGHGLHFFWRAVGKAPEKE